MSVDIFGNSAKQSNRTNVDQSYVDSKFITLTKSLQMKLDKDVNVVNKEYVDGEVSKIVVAAIESIATESAINKQYVDGEVSKIVPMIEATTEAIATASAVNKQYIDGEIFRVISTIDSTIKTDVDSRHFKNSVGLIPDLTSNENNNSGFIVSASIKIG